MKGGIQENGDFGPPFWVILASKPSLSALDDAFHNG
jgi:hypothetical protein